MSDYWVHLKMRRLNCLKNDTFYAPARYAHQHSLERGIMCSPCRSRCVAVGPVSTSARPRWP